MKIRKMIVKKSRQLRRTKLLRSVPFSRLQLVFFALVFASIGGYVVWSISRASGSTANVFVATNGNNNGSNCVRFGTAITNPDSGGTTLCASLSKACQLAQLGDVVEVEAGTYGPQHFTTCNTSGSGVITFQPASGASVTLGNGTSGSCAGGSSSAGICVDDPGPSHLYFKGFSSNNGFTVENTNASLESTDITFDGVSVKSILLVGIISNITVKNSTIGGAAGTLSGAVPAVQRYTGSMTGPSNVLFSNDTFQNIGSTTPGDHSECLHVWGQSSNVSIQKSRFINCGKNPQATGDLNYASAGGDVSNNFFDSNNTYSVLLGCDGGTNGSNTTFQYNSSLGPMYWGNPSCPAGNGNVMRGNYMPYNSSSCQATITYHYNVWKSSGGTSKCSGAGGDIGVTTLDFVSPSTMDLHLTSNANAIGKGDPNSCPSTDIDGNLRPTSPAICDAGAAQFNAPAGGDSTPPTVNMTAPTNDSTVSGSSVSVSANAADNIGVASVQFQVDGSNVGSPVTFAPYNFSWNSTSVSNGSHTLGAIARDAAGNSTAATIVTVTVTNTVADVILGTQAVQTSGDYAPAGMAQAFSASALSTGQTNQLSVYIDTGNTSPTIFAGIYSDSSNSPGSLLGSGSVATGSGGWVTMTLNQTVSLTSGQQYWIAVLGTSGQLHFRDKGSSGTAAPASSSASLTSLPASWTNGIVYNAGPLSAYASPSGGGSADTTNPTVSISAPSDGATVSGTNVTVTANASDNVGVVGVQFEVDGGVLGSEVTSSPYTISWNTTTLTNASHALTAVARDAAGNTATATTINVTVDNPVSPPADATAPTTPANLRRIGATTTSLSLSWDASTDTGGSGVGGYRLFRDGNLVADTTLLSFTDTGLTAATSYNYTIEAYDNANNVSSPSGALNVSTGANAPTVNLSASPTTINSGDSSTISWSSTDSLSCTASGAWSGTKATSGSENTGALTTTSIYDLSCSGAGGTDNTSTTVTVNSSPPPSNPPPPVTVKGDLNGDNHVNIFDLSILLSHYARSGTGDVNSDGVVNVFDLSILLSNYGK